MIKRMVAGLFPVWVILALSIPASAQNPCEEIGSDCRVMTPAEVQAFKERVLAAKAALPVPDTTRYEPNGAAEASTMPFVAEANLPGAVLTCRAWPAGAFPDNPRNSLLFGYVLKAKPGKAAGEEKDAPAAVQGMMADLENLVEVSIRLRPHPFLVDVEDGKIVDVSDPDAVAVEKSAAFLSWESNERTDLHMVFGPRTAKEEETLNLERPASAFAPVKSIELEITGPKTEVAALKKKIDRRAFEALLGPIVR
jgi:hypothetical protein